MDSPSTSKETFALDFSICWHSRKWDAEDAKEPRHDAYVARTHGLIFELAFDENGWSFGRMYSGNMYEFVGETTVTRANCDG